MAKSGTLAGILALFASMLLAQGDQTAEPPALMRLTVMALDSSGQPVMDLAASDFQVSDQGKTENIVFFRRNEGSKAPAPLGPHEYSNRAGGWPHSTAILFDLIDNNMADRLEIWHSLGRSLAQLESGESVYLYLENLEGDLVPIHEIGIAADNKTWQQGVEKALDKAMKNASHARPAGMGQEDQVKKTFVALETLANKLAAFPGRRDIIWITGGVQNVYNPKTTCSGDWIDCALYVPHLSVTLDRDGVSVNPLSFNSSPSPDATRDMEDMGGLTGGRAFFRADIRAALTEVAREGIDNYSIFYAPPADGWDNKFHKVRVASERKGIKIVARQRYYALPDRRPAIEKQKTALVAAYQGPADMPDIGLRAAVTPAEAPKIHLEFRINPADLMLREQGDRFDDALTMLVADYGDTGPIGEPTVSNFNLHLTHEQHDTVLKDGIPIAQDHAISDAIRKVRLILLDQGSNVVGSLTVPAH